MLTRCPFVDCLEVYEIPDELEYKAIQCFSCARLITARSLARHLELDKQDKLHESKGTHASMFDGTASKMPFVAILEEIRSLWNVGSIFRSADGAGFSHLFLVGISGCPPRKEIAKTSLGAEDHVGWSYSAHCLPIIECLRSRGYQIVALEKTANSIPLSQAIAREQLKAPLCLIVGNEVKGVYAETIAASDLVLDLPMRGFKESLNVAVAFGVASYMLAQWSEKGQDALLSPT